MPWISSCIKWISNELDITIHAIVSQLSRYCDVISNRLWRHQQNEDRASETQGRYIKIVVFVIIMDTICHVRNEIMYALSPRPVSALTRVLFLCLFPSLLHNSGNKHENNPLVSAETVRYSSTYIILYVDMSMACITIGIPIYVMKLRNKSPFLFQFLQKFFVEAKESLVFPHSCTLNI